MSDCLFCKIVAGEIPSKPVAQSERAYAFYDIAPQAPVHVLVVSKEHITSADEIASSHGGIIDDMVLLAQEVAERHHAPCKLGHFCGKLRICRIQDHLSQAMGSGQRNHLAIDHHDLSAGRLDNQRPHDRGSDLPRATDDQDAKCQCRPLFYDFLTRWSIMRPPAAGLTCTVAER